MILNLESTKKFIINWMQDYASKSGAKTWIVGLSGGIDSALVALLCKATNIPTHCVAMPCHSSGFSLERAKNFAEEQGLDLSVIDLSQANDSILDQLWEGNVSTDKTALGALRSCLRAPVLSYFAHAMSGIIVGTGNRSEDNLIRYFQKYGDGCVDISPIADLFKSEVYELFAHMAGLEIESTTKASLVPEASDRAINKETVTGPAAAKAIYEAVPTADLWGEDGEQTDEEELGITYDEVEWADRQNENTKLSNKCAIITSEEDPIRHPAWIGYTARQREVVAKVHQMEKATRHKVNPALPVCPVRKQEGLVK